MMEGKMFLVMKLAKSMSLESTGPDVLGHPVRHELLFDKHGMPGQVGVIFVFDSREAAEEYAQGCEIVMIEVA